MTLLLFLSGCDEYYIQGVVQFVLVVVFAREIFNISKKKKRNFYLFMIVFCFRWSITKWMFMNKIKSNPQVNVRCSISDWQARFLRGYFSGERARLSIEMPTERWLLSEKVNGKGIRLVLSQLSSSLSMSHRKRRWARKKERNSIIFSLIRVRTVAENVWQIDREQREREREREIIADKFFLFSAIEDCWLLLFAAIS